MAKRKMYEEAYLRELEKEWPLVTEKQGNLLWLIQVETQGHQILTHRKTRDIRTLTMDHP